MARIILFGCSSFCDDLIRLLGPGHQLERRAAAELGRRDAGGFDLALLELTDPGQLEQVRATRLEAPDQQLVVLSARADADEAVEALRAGAVDYAPLPMDPIRLRLLLEQTGRERQAASHLSYLRARDARGSDLGELIGTCGAMRRVFDLVRRLASRTVSGGAPTILLSGETGTGKGCIARAIHYNGRRRDHPFVEANSAAISPRELESELFGQDHGPGNDTDRARPGLLETADRGTLFIDEVSCLPLAAQAKLLTFLEDRRVRRLGSSVDRGLDLQVVAATNRDLAFMAERDLFRVDLLHRLQVVAIQLPPLRERGADREALATQFLRRYAQEYGQPVKRLGAGTRAVIEEYPWPGNVRELRNAMEQVVLLVDDPVVQPQHLKLRWSGNTGPGRLQIQLPPHGLDLEEVEREVILQALARCKGNVSRAARFLRISRPTLRYRIKRLRIVNEEPQEDL